MVALSWYVPPFSSSALYANCILFRYQWEIASARREIYVARWRMRRRRIWYSLPFCRRQFDVNMPLKFAGNEEGQQHRHENEDADEIAHEGPRRGSRTRKPREKEPKTVVQLNAAAQPRPEQTRRSKRGMPALSPKYHDLTHCQWSQRTILAARHLPNVHQVRFS